MFNDLKETGDEVRLLPEASEEQLLSYYKGIKKIQAIVAVSAVTQSVLSIVFVSATSMLNQRGIFRANLRQRIWTFVELAALVLVLTSLILGVSSFVCIECKRAKLRKMLESEGLEVQDATLLAAIRKESEPLSRVLRASFALEILATVIFLGSEIMMVTEIFRPYGFRRLHESLGLTLNTQCLIDLAALTILLAVSVLRIIGADEKRREESAKTQKENVEKGSGVFSHLSLPLLVLFVGILSTLGKMIQGMEGTGTIEVGRDQYGSFPLGFAMRTVAVAVVILIGMYKAFSAVSECTQVSTRIAIRNFPEKPITHADTRVVGLQSIPDA